MRHKIYCILLLSLLAWLLPACNVHEYPDMPPQAEDRVKVELLLDFNTELPPYRDLIYETDFVRSQEMEYDMRYIVNFYPPEDTKARDLAYERTPLYQFTFTTPASQFGLATQVEVSPGSYRVIAWADFVECGSLADRYYTTADFSSLALIGSHAGCDDTRDAFRGVAEALVSVSEDSRITLEMVRPMAKYKFIATDLDLFISRSLTRDGVDLEPEQVPMRPEDYIIQFRYTGFMPSMYNMFTDRPGDAKGGVYFRGKLIPISENEAELGFDYVFVNGKESTVAVAVDVFDKDGTLLATCPAIDVPLKRSMLTTIRGQFLTSSASAGVSVDPSYAGDFNIPVN